MPQEFIDAIDDWDDECGDTNSFPQLSRTGSGHTVEIRQFLTIDPDATNCAVAERANNVIYIWYHRNEDGSRGSLVCETVDLQGWMRHEIGHIIGLDNTDDSSCTDRVMYETTPVAQISSADCDAAAARARVGGGGGGDSDDGGGSNPGGGADPGNPLGEDRCVNNPNTPGCPGYCDNNPDARGCGTVTTQGVVCIPIPGFGWVCLPLAPPPGGNDGRDGNGWELTVSATGSPGATYGFTLGGAPQNITVSLTGMNKDIDCRVNDNPDTGAGGSIPRSSSGRSHYCTNWGSTSDDSWSGQLGAGAHSVRVYPYRGGSGNYTITVSGDGAGGIIGYTSSSTPTPTPTPTPAPEPTRSLPFTVSETNVSGDQTYRFTLSSTTEVNVVVSDQSTDIDCRINSTSCRNHGGTGDETWSGTLNAGTHTVTVYPFRGSGSYTLTVTGTSTAPSPPLSVPEIPNFRVPSGGSVDTVFPAATGGTPPYVYSVSGLPPGITFVPSTRVASGTLPTVTTDTDYTATYTVTDSASASASVTFVTTVVAQVRPSAPQLTGAVSGRTQTLTWTAPAGGGITRYQLQTRASAAHAWRFTDAGTPSPSSNIGSSVRSWSVVTPWTLVRHYQVRATNAAGDGAWSNVVELTTPPAPPPLSVPGIPDFRLPSGGTVNTVFPAATGGTAPYAYSVSGLPPGITFYPSTRGASGTLPTVSTETTYTITYSVTDSAGASASVTFTATVVPPPPPPPPPLVLPGIPNFRVPSGGVVSTLFPAATGGTPPYAYSLSGLPPGLTFAGSTRIASGTLPTVSTETTYTITYSVADSAGASDAVTFTATVRP